MSPFITNNPSIQEFDQRVQAHTQQAIQEDQAARSEIDFRNQIAAQKRALAAGQAIRQGLGSVYAGQPSAPPGASVVSPGEVSPTRQAPGSPNAALMGRLAQTPGTEQVMTGIWEKDQAAARQDRHDMQLKVLDILTNPTSSADNLALAKNIRDQYGFNVPDQYWTSPLARAHLRGIIEAGKEVGYQPGPDMAAFLGGYQGATGTAGAEPTYTERVQAGMKAVPKGRMTFDAVVRAIGSDNPNELEVARQQNKQNNYLIPDSAFDSTNKPIYAMAMKYSTNKVEAAQFMQGALDPEMADATLDEKMLAGFNNIKPQFKLSHLVYGQHGEVYGVSDIIDPETNKPRVYALEAGGKPLVGVPGGVGRGGQGTVLERLAAAYRNDPAHQGASAEEAYQWARSMTTQGAQTMWKSLRSAFVNDKIRSVGKSPQEIDAIVDEEVRAYYPNWQGSTPPGPVVNPGGAGGQGATKYPKAPANVKERIQDKIYELPSGKIGKWMNGKGTTGMPWETP